ncbi:hypothetical protein GW17_00028295, partial [Ensete ventricosum]
SAFLVFHFHGASSSRMRMKKKLQGGKLKKAHAYRLSPASVSPLHQSPPTPPLLPPLTKALKLSALRPKGTPVIPLTSHLTSPSPPFLTFLSRSNLHYCFKQQQQQQQQRFLILVLPLMTAPRGSTAAAAPHPATCSPPAFGPWPTSPLHSYSFLPSSLSFPCFWRL